VIVARIDGDDVFVRFEEGGDESKMDFEGAIAAGAKASVAHSTLKGVSLALGPALKANSSESGLKFAHLAFMAGLASPQRVSSACECAFVFTAILPSGPKAACSHGPPPPSPLRAL